ncbi:dual specificity protein phosphatase family protein [Cyanobacterium aponinum FACHB-4101]|uniref:dual specificity protein phosphatase family protein n=1 Tax=Cyanobacterium aponinum TaxID=379064 RepID=UPI0016805F7D|nr:dual specificity protein phosphatase family protein [Cyanobacterium aponinum]MBD2394897.1 dual specificity protein phosphatase family protein [Cyanobacterium aponinum FACHB-4101]
MEIIICGVSEVNDYIDEADGVISIMNPAWRIYAPLSITEKKEENRHSVLELEFDDIWSEEDELGLEIVTKDIIYQVINFADNFQESYKGEGKLLIHCHEGISRSSGMALTILTYLTKNIQEAINIVNEIRPQAMPNIEIIRLTDEILNLNGELIDKVFQEYYR